MNSTLTIAKEHRFGNIYTIRTLASQRVYIDTDSTLYCLRRGIVSVALHCYIVRVACDCVWLVLDGGAQAC